MLSLAVLGREGEQVVLSGGALRGVTPGSRWHLAPTVTAGTPVEVTVTAAEPLKARAVAPAEVDAGWRAEALELCLPSPALALQVRAPADRAAALVAEIRRANRPKLLDLVEEDGEAELVAWLLAPRESGGPCPALGALTAETWAVVGRDGRLAVRTRPAAGVEGLVDDLVRVARFRGLLLADAPDQSAELRAGVSLEIAPRGEASPDGIIPEGTFCDMRIHNRTHQDVYVTLLEFGTDMAIASMLPMAGHPDATLDGVLVEAGGTLDLARDYFSRDPRFEVADGLPLHLPDDFPWAAEPGEGGGIGQLAYRLLVTRERADFSFLEQEGTRDIGQSQADNPLAERLSVFHSGRGSRGFIPRAKQASSGAGPFALIDQVVQVRGKPTREISPGTGGKVLFYKIYAGTVYKGKLAVPDPGTGPSHGYWGWLPEASTMDFRLEPSGEVALADALGHMNASTTVRLTNPEFGAVTSIPSAGSNPSWAVKTGGALVAHVMLAGDKLHWYSAVTGDRLPNATLTFSRASLPSGSARHAVDQPA
ncbi:MAG: hypothetical protein R3F43_24215 [bacterium]